MKLFGAVAAATALFANVCSGQVYTAVEDEEGFFRTPLCRDVAEAESDELPALARGNIGLGLGAGANLGALGLVSRGKQQAEPAAKFNASATPFKWYVNPDARNGDDCEADEPAFQVHQGPVIVPLGTYQVCVKFFAANRWFYTTGSNAPCDPTNECCEWFPPKQCTRRNQVPVWFELPIGSGMTCEQAYANGAQPGLGVEYLRNSKVGSPGAICLFINPNEEEEVAKFEEVSVTAAYCPGSCCIFDRN